MRCCTPEVVKATIAGFSGTIVPWWRYFDVPGTEYTPPGGEPTGYPAHRMLMPWIGSHSAMFPTVNTCSVLNIPVNPINAGSTYVPFNPLLGPGLFVPKSDVVWSGIAFPPKSPTGDPLYCINYARRPNTSEFRSHPGAIADGYESYSPGGISCSDPVASFACNSKPPEGFTYGPAAADRVYQEDFNEEGMVLLRQVPGLRPELKARVIRSSAVAGKRVDANLRFDVYCRRRWMTVGEPCNKEIIYEFVCSQKYPVLASPPEQPGTWYCVDYACGPRYYGPQEYEPFDCEQYQCTAPQGYAWPHLKVFPEGHGNTSANLSITLTGAEWSPDIAADPTAWEVTGVEIKRSGSGYQVGQFMYVDFDPIWTVKLTGQYINPFPNKDPLCQTPITWEDDYGKQLIGGFFPIQRIRISSVNDSGGITGVEIVPWYKEPEYKAGGCTERIQGKANKTKYYPRYTRILCHPQSVDTPGTGYKVGDRIEWYCTDPACVTGVAAKAYVTDVDENGGVLDWHIKGSDICMYGYGGFKCGEAWEGDDVPELARADCAGDGYPYGDDERGAYKFDGKRLCSLIWSGQGNPVRKANTISRGFTGDDIAWYQANASTTTACNVHVVGSKCRTTLGVYLIEYKYTSHLFLVDWESEEGPPWQSELLSWFLPYPKSDGGGAVLDGTYGQEVNPTRLGGPITSAFVVEGGAGYAFLDKSHTQPILSKVVPSIGEGTGAEIDSFSFGAVNGFPAIGYASNELHVPSSSRFSYFPVTGATIKSTKRGSGYVVDQEFDVSPEGGVQYSSAWEEGGGDDPDAYPNGCWYGGRFSSELTDSGHLSTPLVAGGANPEKGDKTRESLCRLRVSEVNATGGIVSLSVVHGGMMYRTIWGGGVRHPDARAYIASDGPGYDGNVLGGGHDGEIRVTVNASSTSPTFGQITGVTIVKAGREYADPKGGMVWELREVALGGEIFSATANLMALFPWGMINSYEGVESEYILVGGTMPPVVRRSTACAFSECYHSLINATYGLCRMYSPTERTSAKFFANEKGSLVGHKTNGWEYADEWLGMNVTFLSAPPGNNYGVFRRRSAVPKEQYFYGLRYSLSDFMVIEWDQTLSLQATTATVCPDHSDGRTALW
jgi:hypothetical protein